MTAGGLLQIACGNLHTGPTETVLLRGVLLCYRIPKSLCIECAIFSPPSDDNQILLRAVAPAYKAYLRTRLEFCSCHEISLCIRGPIIKAKPYTVHDGQATKLAEKCDRVFG